MGRPPDIADMKGGWHRHLNADKILVPPGFQTFASPVLDTYKFAKFLAKIAHGFAIDAFGNSFDPLLPNFIRSEARGARYDLVGGVSDDDAPSDNLHELGADWRHYNGTLFATVRIRLFANLGAPAYLVVAGVRL